MGENFFGLTDRGRQRTNNEDSFIAKTVSGPHTIVACVIDGVGGYAGGEVAAQITRDEIINSLDGLKGNIIDHLVATLVNANERIIREKLVSPQHEKMACVATLSLVDIEKNVFYFAHVGDTRLYLFRDGSLIKVTRDHSTVGFLEESGRLTEEAAMLHPKRNEVNKALGYETLIAQSNDFIDTGESPFLPGDTILLCSDGLTDMIPAGKIMSILASGGDLPAKGRLLINAANEAGGKDNITAVLVHNDKSPVRHEVTKPLITLKKDNTNGDPQSKIAGDVTSGLNSVTGHKSGKNINGLILLLCVFFFLGFTYLLFKSFKDNEPAEKPVPIIIPKPRNRHELNLLDSLDAPGNRTVKLTGGRPIVISDTINIKNDSLRIIGNGITLLRDSAYLGPAFMLDPKCRFVLLDSLTLENFNIAILVRNKGLHLKNVRFTNCPVPVQFQQQFPNDTMVSGSPAPVIFYFTDSVKK